MAHFGGAHARRQEGRDRSRHRDRSARSSASSARLIAERFPDHVVLGEEFSTRAAIATRRRSSAGCSIRSTARPTTRTACRSSVRRWRSRSTASRPSAAIYDPEPARAVHRRARPGRVAERRAAAGLGGRHADRLAARAPAFPTACSRTPAALVGLFAEFLTRVARRAAAGVGGARSLLRRRRAVRRLLGADAPSVGHGGRRADRPGGGRPRHRLARAGLTARAPGASLATNGRVHDADGASHRTVFTSERPVTLTEAETARTRSAADSCLCPAVDGLTSRVIHRHSRKSWFYQVLRARAWHCSCSTVVTGRARARDGASRNGASHDETDVAAGSAVSIGLAADRLPYCCAAPLRRRRSPA